MKNSADQGGCYPQRPKAEVDNTLRDRRSERRAPALCSHQSFMWSRLQPSHIWLAKVLKYFVIQTDKKLPWKGILLRVFALNNAGGLQDDALILTQGDKVTNESELIEICCFYRVSFNSSVLMLFCRFQGYLSLSVSYHCFVWHFKVISQYCTAHPYCA